MIRIIKNTRPANGTYESFIVWQLTGWLIDNYYEYKNEMKEYPYKNMSRNNRIEAKLEGVKSNVRSLKILDLIEEKGLIKASRGDEKTMSLSFTNFGYLLAWIIEGLHEEQRQTGNIQICNALEYNHKDRSSSFDFFGLALIKKYRSHGLFEEASR